ncbi:MAG: mechanosensitive ion channel [Prevotellaceae bacterium]|jgi:small conductance mechanosensitive channel|nr:mechanosensitive ion channel [Prevotellaceae bacterium]
MDPLKNIENISWWEQSLHTLRDNVVDFGGKLLLCIIIYFVGRKLIKYIKVLVNKLLSKREFDPSVVSFLKSLIDIVLTAALLITIVNILGINNSSFVAILASAGVAMGMAMSGTLQNFAGGVMILLFRPYRIGDYIQAQGQEGTVKEIHIFNTEITTFDNKTVFIPNGGLSSNVIVNYNNKNTRRIDLTIGVEYGTDYDFAKSTIKDILLSDKRILPNPTPFIALKTLNESSVDILIRVWVNTPDYWDVYFNLNEQIYKIFGKNGIGIPFPQMTVHLAGKD